MPLTALGRPRAKMWSSACGCWRAKLGRIVRRLDFRRMYQRYNPDESTFPNTVAAAAPTTPMLHPRISMGSKIRLSAVPVRLPQNATLTAPSARSNAAKPVPKSINGAPTASTRKYAAEWFIISGVAPSTLSRGSVNTTRNVATAEPNRMQNQPHKLEQVWA
jgi:hypothetical protein